RAQCRPLSQSALRRRDGLVDDLRARFGNAAVPASVGGAKHVQCGDALIHGPAADPVPDGHTDRRRVVQVLDGAGPAFGHQFTRAPERSTICRHFCDSLRMNDANCSGLSAPIATPWAMSCLRTCGSLSALTMPSLSFATTF